MGTWAKEREQFSPCWLCRQIPERSRWSVSFFPAARTRLKMSWSSPHDVARKEKTGKSARRYRKEKPYVKRNCSRRDASFGCGMGVSASKSPVTSV